jgi:hypothetical protein
VSAYNAIKSGKLPPLASIAADRNEGPGELTDALALTLSPSASSSSFADFVSQRGDFFAFGSGPEETYDAQHLIDLVARVRGTIELDGHVRGELVPGGGAGWAVANVRWPEANVKLPLRVFFVFERDAERGRLTLAQAHFAVAR